MSLCWENSFFTVWFWWWTGDALGVKISLLAQGMEWTLKAGLALKLLLNISFPPAGFYTKPKFCYTLHDPKALNNFITVQNIPRFGNIVRDIFVWDNKFEILLLWQHFPASRTCSGSSWAENPLVLRGESWISESPCSSWLLNYPPKQQESVPLIGGAGLGIIFSQVDTKSWVFLQLESLCSPHLVHLLRICAKNPPRKLTWIFVHASSPLLFFPLISFYFTFLFFSITFPPLSLFFIYILLLFLLSGPLPMLYFCIFFPLSGSPINIQRQAAVTWLFLTSWHLSQFSFKEKQFRFKS